MRLIKCKTDDFARITEFYKYAIDNSPTMETYGRWIYGQHPTDEMIKSYIDGGYMYYAQKDQTIIAAIALTPFQTEDYHSVNWSVSLNDNEVLVVHILCVNPSCQKQGIAKQIMEEVISLAKSIGMRAIRLDALCCNEPAHKLYENCGFTKRGIQNWYADNTGWIDFYLYEFILE